MVGNPFGILSPVVHLQLIFFKSRLIFKGYITDPIINEEHEYLIKLLVNSCREEIKRIDKVFMDSINEKCLALSRRSEQIILYQKFSFDKTLERVSRLPYPFDNQLLEFLKFTNGASMFDYCFMGFNNNRLGSDIDEDVESSAIANPLLAGELISFMGTSTSDIFGYLVNMVDEFGNHAIAYNSLHYPQKIFVIASSFENFMKTFLDDVEDTLHSRREAKFLLGIDKDEWPLAIEHWFENDRALREMYLSGAIRRFFEERDWGFAYGKGY